MPLPPGVTVKDFADALSQFNEAVGKEWVFTSDEDVALYRDAYSPFWDEPEERVASAAVAPNTVEEVQKIVKTANEYKISPSTPSRPARTSATSVPRPILSGSDRYLDLKRMNRVLRSQRAY